MTRLLLGERRRYGAVELTLVFGPDTLRQSEGLDNDLALNVGAWPIETILDDIQPDRLGLLTCHLHDILEAENVVGIFSAHGKGLEHVSHLDVLDCGVLVGQDKYVSVGVL